MIGKKAALIFVLAAVLLSACAGPEPMTDGSSPAPENTPPPVIEGLETMYAAYEAALNVLFYERVLPDGTYLEDDGGGMDGNFFAVFDVDADGWDELIIEYSNTYIAAMTEMIFGYDDNSGELHEEFMRYPDLTYYDNGIIKARCSHNQGLAGRFWPFYLYKYDPEQDRYECVAIADAWDGSVYGEDYNGRPFPGELDTSGEGIVYYLGDEDEKTLGGPVDKREYERWLNSYIGGAGELTVPKVPLTPENIASGAHGTTGLWIEQDAGAERNFYSTATSLSKAEVERFALEVRASVLSRDWAAFAEYVNFPVTVNGLECADSDALLAMAPELLTAEDFVTALVSETCEEMFCSYSGIIMADGRIHLAEVLSDTDGGELRVIAINTHS